MVRSDRVVYHVYLAPEMRLAAIDARSLEVLDDYPLPEVQDPHSVCLHRGRLHVVSTGTDQIPSYGLVKTGPSSPGRSGRPAEQCEISTTSMAWRNSEATCGAQQLVRRREHYGPRRGCGYFTNINERPQGT